MYKIVENSSRRHWKTVKCTLNEWTFIPTEFKFNIIIKSKAFSYLTFFYLLTLIVAGQCKLKSILSVIAEVPEEWKGVKRALLKIVFLREKKGWPQFWGTIWLSWNGRGVNFSFYEMHPEGRLQRQTEILWNSMQFLWKVFCISFFLSFLCVKWIFICIHLN